MYELIICEKPSACKKIAEALADTKPTQTKKGKVTYYSLKHNKKEILVGCAVGHLFGLSEKEKSPWGTYPVFDIEWKPAAEISKRSAFSNNIAKTMTCWDMPKPSIIASCPKRRGRRRSMFTFWRAPIIRRLSAV